MINPITEPRIVPMIEVPANYRKIGKRNWHQRRRARALLSLLSRVRGKVLDHGCGYGDITFEISKTHTVQGVDVDPARINFATREYAPIPFSVCEPDGIPFGNGSFDVVVSSTVIHFVPDVAQYLGEIRRILSDGGHLLLLCANVLIVQHAISRLLGRRPRPPVMRILPWSEVVFFLDKAGFRIEAETYFYDPPFVSWRNPAEVLVGTINQALSLLRVRATSGYFLILARKQP